MIDTAAIANAKTEFVKEIAEMVKQLEEAQRLYDSVNGFTNMDEIADALNNPKVRELLGPEFMDIATSLTAPIDSLGDLADEAQSLADFTNVTADELNAEDFYRTELDRITDKTARDGAIGDSIVQGADDRLAGLEQLRQKIGSVSTQKEMDALQGRIQIESAMLQNDTNRIQGLAMLQKAQSQLSGQRATEGTLLKSQEIRSFWEDQLK